MVFLPVEPTQRLICEGIVERIAREEGLTVLGWRDTPFTATPSAAWRARTQPYIEQVFLRGAAGMTQDELERKLYLVRAPSGIRVVEIERQEFLLRSLAVLADRSFTKACCWPRRSRTSTRNCRIPTRELLVHGPPALLHQHVPQLATGASLPLDLPQRRNQHRSRKRELDERARVDAAIGLFGDDIDRSLSR